MEIRLGARDYQANTDLPPFMLDDVLELLRDLGHDASLADSESGVGVDPFGLSEDLLLWVKDNLARDAAIAVAGAVAQRLRVKYKEWKKPRVVKVLYGPTGDVVARVSVHEEEAGD